MKTQTSQITTTMDLYKIEVMLEEEEEITMSTEDNKGVLQMDSQ
jgi:hypothetical protein